MTVCAALGSAGSAFAEEQKRVLVLYAARRDAQIAIVGDRELPRLLGRGFRQASTTTPNIWIWSGRKIPRIRPDSAIICS